jgi:hypothetical protein
MATMKLIYEGDIITQCVYYSQNHFEQIKLKWSKRYPKHLFDKSVITGDLKPRKKEDKAITLPEPKEPEIKPKKRVTVKSNTPTHRYKLSFSQKTPF